MIKQRLTEHQNIVLSTLFPAWSMEKDSEGNIVIYPNIEDDLDAQLEQLEEEERWDPGPRTP